MRTRIKICGITQPQQALAAAAAGADAVGLVFYPPSSRALEPAAARDIAAVLPAFVSSVALFLDADAGAVGAVLRVLRPDVLQFHGNESPAFCRSFGLPYMKAVPMGSGADPRAFAREYSDARALLLDGHRAGEPGGRGAVVPRQAGLTQEDGPPLMLAGGLTPANVGAAIRDMRPYGVDVSSGVESAPGTKDPQLIQAFCEAVYAGERVTGD